MKEMINRDNSAWKRKEKGRRTVRMEEEQNGMRNE